MIEDIHLSLSPNEWGMENLNINPSFLNSYHMLKNMKKCHASTGKSFCQIMKFLEAIQTQILWDSNQLQVVQVWSQ